MILILAQKWWNKQSEKSSIKFESYSTWSKREVSNSIYTTTTTTTTTTKLSITIKMRLMFTQYALFLLYFTRKQN
jgi:hypothetical protein